MQDKSAEELQLECSELEGLLQNFELSEHSVSSVIKRETVDKTVKSGEGVPDYKFGMSAFTGYEGYGLLIRAFMTLNADSLSEEECGKLKKALEILENMY